VLYICGKAHYMPRLIYLYIILGTITLFYSCREKETSVNKAKPAVTERLDFNAIKGITYHEVKRRFSNGLSFDSMGFQQEPSWIIKFKSNDTVAAYSPQRNRMQRFYLHYDHGDVYNFAKEWFRIKGFNKDSIQMQRLYVSDKEIASDVRSDVNLTFYSEDYIKNTLKTTAAELQKPSARDTAFIKSLSETANRFPTDENKVFAGRQPAQLIPNSKLISVEKISAIDVLNGKTEAYDYLYPKYRVVIKKAYKDFGYTFTVFVDQHGKLSLGTFTGAIPEFREVRKKVLEGIIDVYLQNLLIIKPGTTLGIPHASLITVTVKGTKGTK
jgi:hypothetical protein